MTAETDCSEYPGDLPDIVYKAIVVESSERPELKKIIRALHFDSPRSGDHLRNDGLLQVSGWILLNSTGLDVKVVANRAIAPVESGLNISRPDVVRRVLSLDPAEAPDLVKCGFSFGFASQELNTIELLVYDIYYPLRLISCIDSSVTMENLACVWKSYNSNALESIDLDSMSLLSSIDARDFNAFIWGSVRAVASDRFIGLHQEVEGKCLERFVSFLSNPSLSQVFLNDAINHGFLRLPSPFEQGEAKCNQSLHFKGNITALRFICNDGECFYVLQHVGSADAVYFPNRKLALLLKHFNVDMVKSFALSMARDLANLIKSSCAIGCNDFQGIIASHGRPYHFYYDVATAVYKAGSSGLLNKVPEIIYYNGADFCSFKDVFSLECEESIYTPEQISRVTKEKSVFYFHLGDHYSGYGYKLARGFDQLMLTNARAKFDYTDSEYISAQSCYPLVWFGLTVEKRSWAEQVDGIANIINLLSDIYPRLGVVFDGWTSPLNPTSGDEHQAAEDTRVAEEIKKLLSKPVSIYSVIGAPSDRKIIFAKIIDVFVTNSGTGSLHVTRFAQRPGVGHLNTRMIDMPDHIRPNIRLVDKDYIVDEPNSASKRMDFVSYSIDWKVIYEMVEEILQG